MEAPEGCAQFLIMFLSITLASLPYTHFSKRHRGTSRVQYSRVQTDSIELIHRSPGYKKASNNTTNVTQQEHHRLCHSIAQNGPLQNSRDAYGSLLGPGLEAFRAFALQREGTLSYYHTVYIHANTMVLQDAAKKTHSPCYISPPADH